VHRTWLKLIFGHKKDVYWIQSHLPYPDGDFKNLTITKRLIQSSDIRIGEYPMDRIAPEKESKAPLEGKTVLITGGGRGIGAATAKLLASRGANVIVNYLRNKEAAERLVAEIKSSKETEQQHTAGDAITIQADVRDADQVQRMVDEAIRKYGQIDILVNNANTGRYELKAFLETTWQDFLELYSDEMKAAYEVTRSVLPSMLKR
jgi:short-subunit dehydrogenase